MFKIIMLVPMLSSLLACSSFNELIQCDADKNYVISNSEAIENYKKLLSNNKIKSVYYEEIPTERCNWDSCMSFDNKKFNFIEKYFNDEYRKGIYTVNVSTDLDRKDCVAHNSGSADLKNLCFYTVKNENIKSNYKKINHKINDYRKLSLIDSENNEILFEYAYQFYSTNAVGSIGFGVCKIIKNNNPNYKFDQYRLGI